jgi:hypothetical protein
LPEPAGNGTQTSGSDENWQGPENPPEVELVETDPKLDEGAVWDKTGDAAASSKTVATFLIMVLLLFLNLD